jgi:hypothetical protein
MGSGSSRGGGSGAGGSGTGGGGGGGVSGDSTASGGNTRDAYGKSKGSVGSAWSNGIGYLFQRAGLVSKTIGKKNVRTDIRDILITIHRGNRTYFERQFHGPMILELFKSLFQLHCCLLKSTEKERTECLEELGLPQERGALRKWAAKKLEQLKEAEPDQRIRETGRTVFEDVLTRIMRDDPDLYLNASISGVAKSFDLAILTKLSNHIFSSLIWNVIVREKERSRPSAESQLIQECGGLAVDVLDAFKEKFDGRFSEFLELTSREREWFFKTLTHEGQ